MFTLPNLKDEVAKGRQVQFDHYKDGKLWYKTDSGFLFPVPIDDIGDGKFLAIDKAILFMRYIRKQIDLIKEGLNQ